MQAIDLDRPIEPRPPGHSIPLTSSQARIWIGSLRSDGGRSSTRMCASAVRIDGSLSIVLLERSIDIVIRRHEALRTRIVVRSGIPCQDIGPAPAHVLSVVDLSDQPSCAHREVVRLVEEFIETSIDLLIGPLFEARIWRLSDYQHVLVLLIDHIVSDGVSNGIVAREVWECYRQVALGQPVSLPEIPVQFPDYAVWQARTRLAWMEKHGEYWREHLRGAAPTVIPADRIRSDRMPETEAIKHIPFGDALTSALREAARREHALLSVFVLAAYAVALSDWCRKEDLLLAFASHARHRSALRNVVGFLANMLYLRIQVKRDHTFSELLAQVKRELATALEHRDFDRVAELLPECATNVGYNWQSTHSTQGSLDHYVATECEHPLSRSFEFEFDPGIEMQKSSRSNHLRVLPFPVRSSGFPTQFIPVIFDTPSTLLMMIRFDSRTHAPDTIERFADNLFAIAKVGCQRPTAWIASMVDKLTWTEDGGR